MDATGKVKTGPNVIAIRVWNNAEIGGWFRRGFLWAPTPATLAEEKKQEER